MTTTTATATNRPATEPKDDDEFDDEFKTEVQDKAARWLHAKATPTDGKETKSSAAARLLKDFMERFGWSAFEFVRGETAENRGDIDVLNERINEIDPPDFEEYLNKVLGFTIGADAYFKYVTKRFKDELDKAGVKGVFDEHGNFVQEQDKDTQAKFALILGEVHEETAEILASDYGPDDDDSDEGSDEEEGDEDDDDEGDTDPEGKPAEDKPAA